jgi:hypothetical protein
MRTRSDDAGASPQTRDDVDRLDWDVRGMKPWSRAIALAAAEAILCDADDAGDLVPARAGFPERGVDALDHSLGRASLDVRRGFMALSLALEWLPLFVVGRASRMSRLPLADRLAYLEALESSRVGLLSMLLVAFKVPICIPAFEDPPELFETGFDRPDTTARRKRLPIGRGGAS